MAKPRYDKLKRLCPEMNNLIDEDHRKREANARRVGLNITKQQSMTAFAKDIRKAFSQIDRSLFIIEKPRKRK